MLVISPYARRGYVDDAFGEFSAPLRFISDNWGLPYLTPRIRQSHNFEHVFDFEGKPASAGSAAACSGDGSLLGFPPVVPRLARRRAGRPEDPLPLTEAMRVPSSGMQRHGHKIAVRPGGSVVTGRPVVVVIVSLVLAGCGGTTASSGATGSTTPTPTSTVQEVDVGGYLLDIECEGEGSPTVVFEAGAGGDRSSFLNQWVDLRDITRVCAYDRAGIGTSDERPTTGSVTIGDLADELARLLEGAGIEEPIVLASHSLGGGVAQFFADRYPDHVAGLVFVDSIAIPGYVDWFGSKLDDGTGGSIDMRRSAEEWEQIGSFGSTPTIVLTQGFAGEDDSAPQRFRRYFRERARRDGRAARRTRCT